MTPWHTARDNVHAAVCLLRKRWLLTVMTKNWLLQPWETFTPTLFSTPFSFRVNNLYERDGWTDGQLSKNAHVAYWVAALYDDYDYDKDAKHVISFHVASKLWQLHRVASLRCHRTTAITPSTITNTTTTNATTIAIAAAAVTTTTTTTS